MTTNPPPLRLTSLHRLRATTAHGLHRARPELASPPAAPISNAHADVTKCGYVRASFTIVTSARLRGGNCWGAK